MILVEDQENNELRALIYLNAYADTFLYVTRPIDGEVLLLLDEAADTVALYNLAEESRGRILSTFALVYPASRYGSSRRRRGWASGSRASVAPYRTARRRGGAGGGRDLDVKVPRGGR